VVGNQQGTGYGVCQVGFQLDPQRIEDRGRPGLLEQQAPPVAANAEQRQGDDGPAEDQQGQSQATEGANEEVGLVQASCPR